MIVANRLRTGSCSATGIRWTGVVVLLIAATACAKKEPPGPPPFSLGPALPALSTYGLDDAFLAGLQSLKDHVNGDPVLASAHVRFAIGGLAAGLATGNPATSRLLGAGGDAAAIRAFLASLAPSAAVAPAPMKAALQSLSTAFGPGGGDLSAALAFASTEGEAAPAFRALLAARLLEGLRMAADVAEVERDRRLREAVPGLAPTTAQGGRTDAFAFALKSLAILLGAGPRADAGLAAPFARLGSDAAALLGARAWPLPVSPGAGPRGGIATAGVPATYTPLLVLSLDAEGLKAGLRPTLGWVDGRVTDLSANPGFPGPVVLASNDLENPAAPALAAGRDAIAKALGAAEPLEAKAFPSLAGAGILSADRGDRGRPVAVQAGGDLPAARLKNALDLAAAAGLQDVRILPDGLPGRVLPVFFKAPRPLPDVAAPKGPRLLVVLTPAGADVHPPAKPALPMTGWPEGVQAVADGKNLFKLSVRWDAASGFGGKVTEAVGALRARVPAATPVVDVVIRAKDVLASEVADAAAEVLAVPGPPLDALPAYFPGLACTPGVATCSPGASSPSTVPALFSDAVVPKPGKPQTVMAETRPSGFCDQAAVKRIIMGRSGAFRACYEAELQRYGSLEGRLELRFTIEPDGSVSGITPTQNELNKSVEACIVRQVSQLKFTKPDGGICIIRWPFRFQPGG